MGRWVSRQLTSGQSTTSDFEDQAVDPTYKIGRLRAANQRVYSVSVNDGISVAITEMMAHGFSQLGVVDGQGTILGVVSWRTLAQKLALNRDVSDLSECLEQPHQIPADASLLKAIPVIAEADYVLVRSSDGESYGIVTAADLSSEFHQLTERFLLLAEIERHIRKLIRRRIPLAVLQKIAPRRSKQRPIQDVSDLTLGEYAYAIHRPEIWEKLELRNIDREAFVRHLRHVVAIRNKVMHFNDGHVGHADTETLRNFAGLLQSVVEAQQTASPARSS